MSVDHPPTPRSVLWVLAHPRQESLNGHLFRSGVEALARDRDVMTSDLYAQGFDPVLGARDLGELAGEPGNLGELAGQAYVRGQAPSDVQAEHEKLARGATMATSSTAATVRTAERNGWRENHPRFGGGPGRGVP